MAQQLSKNKIKFIRRNAGKMEPARIAAELKIPLEAVTAQLENNRPERTSGNQAFGHPPLYLGF